MTVAYALLATQTFFSRPKVIVHASESRFRGKKGALRCKDVILSGVCPKVPPSVLQKLQDRDREVRKQSLRLGCTHVRSLIPAKRVSSASENRARSLARLLPLPPVCQGRGRKRKGNASDLEFAPSPSTTRNYVALVPLTIVRCKTPTCNLQHDKSKRLKSKSESENLYRRV